MSLSHPSTPSDAGPDKRTYEPSMEEILASIRRIIADDQSLPMRDVTNAAEHPLAAKPVPRAIPPSHPAAEERVTSAGPARADAADPSTPYPASPYSTTAPYPASPEPTRVGPARQAHVVPPQYRPQAAHGEIAAPQFAMPNGPVSDAPDAAHAAAAMARDMMLAANGQATNGQASNGQATSAEAMSGQAMGHPAQIPAREDADQDGDGAPDQFAARHSDHTSVDEASEPAPALFSSETDTAIASAFKMLAATRLADNSDDLMALAREMIRPLLRTWIDENMPAMVERMVRAEIERVARGGR